MQIQGIKVAYNGKINSIFYPPDGDIDYKVGELLLDIYETDMVAIENIIQDCLIFESKISEKEFMDALDYIMEKLEVIYSAVFKSALLNSFQRSFYIYQSALSDGSQTAVKITTINGLLEICWEEFNTELKDFKWFFEAVVADMNHVATTDDKDIISGFKKLYREKHNAQGFTYEIIIDPDTDEFMSVYTVNSLLSLLAFEYSHLVENGIVIKKCKNCGRYFIPENRSDTIYCNFPSPQDSDRTCRHIGAQIAMQNRINEDATAKAYRKKYQSLNMAYQREQDENLKERHLSKREQFKVTGQEKKKQLKAGTITAEEFVEWCERFL